MKKAFVFPGQGAQFVGMGKDLYDQIPARQLLDQAERILGFPILRIMFEGSEEALKETKVTQPAIFLHSCASLAVMDQPSFDMVAGHSLGEFTALYAAGVVDFPIALELIALRATAMQQACEQTPSAMAAVLGLEDEKIIEVCASCKETVVAANFNSPGQVVISGTNEGIAAASEALKKVGAKKVIPLPVRGAFHSPLMASAEATLAAAIRKVAFQSPSVPVYQNISARAETAPDSLKENLIRQLTGPVKWTQTVQAMIADGATHFTEVGPSKVLSGLIKKISPDAVIAHS